MNLMEAVIKVIFDSSDVDKGTKETQSKMSSFTSKLGEGLKTVAKVGAAAVATASTAVMAMTKSAVDGYADYEQLVGGVETLFGAGGQSLEEYARSIGKTVSEATSSYLDLMNAQTSVMDNAKEAYKTAGLSANEYMETVTSFSASLISALDGDTKKAADYADMAIVDMADNANKMGTSMESIQNAYQGFAKQNYTMLDNLKLGYGGTKSEMERLIEDAEKLDATFTATRDENDALTLSYSDIIDAIHIVQTNMGITGTTAKEASETISGSLSSLKSAWDNLVVGLADNNADLDGLIDNVVESAETAFNNILPAAEKAINGIANFIEKIAPVIADKLPALVEEVLPSVLSAATQLLNAVVVALPTLFQILINQIPMIIEMIVPTFISLLPEIVRLGLQLIIALAEGIADNLDTLIPAIVEVIMEIVEILTEPEMLMKLIDAAFQILIALADGLIQAIPELLKSVPTIILNLVTALIELAPELVKVAYELITTLALSLVEMEVKLADAAIELFATIQDTIKERIDRAKEWGRDLIENFVGGIKDKIGSVKDAMTSVGDKIKSFIHFSEPDEGPLSNFHTYAPDMMELFAKGMRDNTDLVQDQFAKSFDFSDITTTVNGNGAVGTLAQSTTSSPQWENILGNITLVMPMYIGGDKVDEKIVSAIDAFNFKSGGR